MNPPDSYAWLRPLAMQWLREQRAADEATKKPRLTLVTPDFPLPKTRKPKMQKTPDTKSRKDEINAILCEASAAAEPTLPPGVHRKYTSLKPIDHISIAHGALEALRSLTIPSHGAGISAAGVHDDLGMLSRNHLCDLLEIINDRIELALEMDGAR